MSIFETAKDKLSEGWNTTKNKVNAGKEYAKTKKEQFTGESVEHKIDEYSEIYGEILLGMHKELSELKFKLNIIEDEQRKDASGTNELDFSSLKLYKSLSIVSLIISLGVALWTIIF